MSDNDNVGVFGVLVMLAVMVLMLVFGPRSCTDDDTARRVLEQNGYTEIEITGWRPLMKAESDTFSTGFRAKAPNGKVVTGAVTSGWMKGATIRFD